MRYRAMAKHLIYERAKMQAPPSAEEGERLGAGRAFTDAQLSKFTEALNQELDKMYQDLLDQNIVV